MYKIFYSMAISCRVFRLFIEIFAENKIEQIEPPAIKQSSMYTIKQLYFFIYTDVKRKRDIFFKKVDHFKFFHAFISLLSASW
jgi:hypothetical protein